MKENNKQDSSLTLDRLYQQGKVSLPDYWKKIEEAFDGLYDRYPEIFEGAYLEADLKRRERVEDKVQGDLHG